MIGASSIRLCKRITIDNRNTFNVDRIYDFDN